ncbi:nitrous oxide reductase accessory protein NosL [Rhodobacter capsulatus]|uniref:nitrous oxide reductase accessory protein NosL n=1 Tax=Rhodobacter capsulatus TaxID=1061 RepID=UPI0006DC4BD2|nr:nitrous oxide reductase accessory protein NosL [Rhodobacter capsulatus]KQB11553.1 nitrous oxide reductase accessory protein NosL [Rhodobacter capsulatus]KQB12405.1 nitrous oxide reductase accessory protein NosL [Rhodobacter capsulatus]PZX25837.1 nitrous oxide reductase accessory protein NosL [Rhodobacter capsulatus]QNR64137.1 nitrous oxide reductase accessory protein NosL [Rhodobacter capsulatus]
MCNLSRRNALGLLAGVPALALCLPQATRAEATPVNLPKPGPRDTCPVCGMFVARYPDWIATLVFADGVAFHFDGPKDCFKFLNDMPRYAAGRRRDQITAMGVTDYYGLRPIAAETALYAIGSDVLGPMGHDFVPLASDAEAADFMRDHAGKRLLRFADVPADLPAKLDEGRFE